MTCHPANHILKILIQFLQVHFLSYKIFFLRWERRGEAGNEGGICKIFTRNNFRSEKETWNKKLVFYVQVQTCFFFLTIHVYALGTKIFFFRSCFVHETCQLPRNQEKSNLFFPLFNVDWLIYNFPNNIHTRSYCSKREFLSSALFLYGKYTLVTQIHIWPYQK